MMLTFIGRAGNAVLWSWGNYCYSIDVCGKEVLRMVDTDLEDALKRLAEYGEIQYPSSE
jgi:hypothetical protein